MRLIYYVKNWSTYVIRKNWFGKFVIFEKNLNHILIIFLIKKQKTHVVLIYQMVNISQLINTV